MTKVFWLVEVNDEEIIPKIRQVISMEVLFWILSLMLALSHVGLQGASDQQFSNIIQSSNFTIGESTEELTLVQEASLPSRGPIEGGGGVIAAVLVSFVGMVAVSACFVKSIFGFRKLGADGGPGGLKLVFYCEMIGATLTLLMIIAALQTGSWYSEAKNWADSSDASQFCVQSFNNTSVNGTVANVTEQLSRVNGTLACKAAALDSAGTFGTVGTFYFAFLAGLVPIVFLCGCSARLIFQLSPSMMISTGSMEAAVQRVRRSSIVNSIRSSR